MRLFVDNLEWLRGAFQVCEQLIACVDTIITTVNTVAIPKVIFTKHEHPYRGVTDYDSPGHQKQV